MTTIADFHHILIVEDSYAKRVFPLTDDQYSIGRDSSNQITIREPQVSRHHATLIKLENSFYKIVDGDLQGNRSRNGLVINGTYCLEQNLKHGDIITFGGKSQGNYYIVSNPAVISFLVNSSTDDAKNVDLEELSKSTIPSQEYLNILNDPQSQDLIRLASFPELSPTPIVEINAQGELIYLNASACLKFSDIYQRGLDHPILAGLLQENYLKQGSLIVREIQIDSEYFDQYVHYLSEKQLIRSYIFDLTRRRQAEKALQEAEARYRAIVKQIYEGILLVDINSRKIIEVNEAYCQLVGYTSAEIYQLTLDDLIPDFPDFWLKLQEVVTTDHDFIGDSVHRRQDNSLVDVEISVSLINYHEQQVYCLTVRDITQRKRNEELLEYQAFHDALTGLPNRTSLEKYLRQTLREAASTQELVAIMFLDIDHFKKVNDTLGHSMGDQLLRSFANRLHSSLRGDDFIARWGGDEFTAIIPHVENPEAIINLAQRILDSFTQPITVITQQLYVKTSIGIAVYPQDGEDAETLLKNADTALYCVKQQGRNNYQLYNTNLSVEVSNLLNLENMIAQGLATEQFFLYYQPRVKINTQEITAMQVFLQWQHPTQDLVSFEEFFPLAEATEQIIPLGDWLIETACRQNSQWQSQGLPTIPVSISLSSRQFQQSMLVNKIQQILELTGLAPNLLELTVKEKDIIEEPQFSAQTLTQLLDMGVRISIGDFGMSYRFLEYLRKFGFDNLKIEPSFVQELESNEYNKGIVSAIIALGNSFKMKVVAEGVVQPEQIQSLRQLDCQEIQGSLLSQPIDSNAATELLARGIIYHQ